MQPRPRIFAFWLTLLLGLFVFRVVAQLLQAFFALPFLPPFESWQSGALPYHVLVAFQLAIIGYCWRTIRAIRRGTLVPNARSAKLHLLAGGLYLAVMLFRLVAGFTFAAEHPWLGVHLPTFFHLVLAAFLILVGLYHAPRAREIVAWSSYPLVMSIAVGAHLISVHNGVNLLLSTYAPILTGALVITLLERLVAYRDSWLPARADVSTDTAFMLLVQVLLPRFLAFLVAITALGALEGNDSVLQGLWPRQLPVPAQAILMMVTADFMRYWIHRLAHGWTPLWQLHAVHHSPHKLYWINVGRFHPLEKALQYLFDALPFILLGVAEEVLALYFVFYSLNGFFQHCNIELRLGVLNYLISGPELHRWHHSRFVEQSNNNYGNNLIIWDLLFGTWYLPADRQVGELGLLNRQYPLGFLEQMRTPFVSGLDKAAR